MFGGRDVDIFEGDEQRIYEAVSLGDSAFDDQENEQARHQVG